MSNQPIGTFPRNDRWLSSSSASVYAESQTTKYESYQQAWRLLGYFVDCGQKYNYNGAENDEDGGSISCPRYLLWGAYVDPFYSGGGVNEYQYYRNGQYDDAACTDGSRCAKMDCHDKHTNFQLIGVFKQPYYSTEWFDTLLKHQCVLDDDTYDTILAQECVWPEECVATGTYVKAENGSEVQLYLDLQSSVTLQLALYTDSSCKFEYTGEQDVSIDTLASTVGLPTKAETTLWNQALEQFYYCQPCMSLDLRTTENQRRKLDDNVPFACTDKVGEVNVNQCAYFRQNTQMEAASWHDLDIAAKQGGLATLTLGGQQLGIPLNQISMAPNEGLEKHAATGYIGLVIGGVFLLLSGAFLMVTLNWKLARRRRHATERRRLLSEPLFEKTESQLRIKSMASF